uniref:Phosphorylated adapter RNA export protein n=1 Tax=Otolemur garnettii TaxID=30611 RepID=H0XLB8_OTOGA
LFDSDSDMTIAPNDKPLQVQEVLMGATAAYVPVSHYRTVKSVDSSEESFSNSDNDSCLWKRKQQKCFNLPPKPEPFQFDQSSQKPPIARGKINNIWGAVLRNRIKDAVATELGILGMEGTINRSSTSHIHLRFESSPGPPNNDGCNQKIIPLGWRLSREPSQNGGLFIMNVSQRRRTGGVFLNLLKNTPSISEEQIKDIFYIENQKEYENKEAARKRTQVLGKKMKQAIKSLNFQEDDDTSRDASDTNEALASLDKSQEGQGEAKLDAEEAIEVDHSHDLDIF